MASDPWLLAQLAGHFALLSLLAIGGAITTAPDMQRILVRERGWLDAEQFNAAIAIGQAAPGPNVLFVAVLGYFVAGLPGAAAAMAGTLLPSTTLALAAVRWGERHPASAALQAFTTGMAPVTIGLLVSTAWLLIAPQAGHPVAVALFAGTLALMVRTKASPLWPLAAGAVAGALGWV